MEYQSELVTKRSVLWESPEGQRRAAPASMHIVYFSHREHSQLTRYSCTYLRYLVQHALHQTICDICLGCPMKQDDLCRQL